VLLLVQCFVCNQIGWAVPDTNLRQVRDVEERTPEWVDGAFQALDSVANKLRHLCKGRTPAPWEGVLRPIITGLDLTADMINVEDAETAMERLQVVYEQARAIDDLRLPESLQGGKLVDGMYRIYQAIRKGLPFSKSVAWDTKFFTATTASAAGAITNYSEAMDAVKEFRKLTNEAVVAAWKEYAAVRQNNTFTSINEEKIARALDIAGDILERIDSLVAENRGVKDFEETMDFAERVRQLSALALDETERVGTIIAQASASRSKATEQKIEQPVPWGSFETRRAYPEQVSATRAPAVGTAVKAIQQSL